MERTKYLLFLFSLLPFTSLGQPYINIMQLRYEYLPDVAYNANRSTILSTSVRSADLFLPLKLKTGDVVVAGAGFDQIHLRIKGNDIAETDDLYSIAFQAGGIKQWNEQWSMLCLVLPRINSDLNSLSPKHLQIGGISVFTYNKREDLKFKIGLYYNREYFGNFFMPLAGIDWKVNSNINLFGVLPGNFNFEYKMSRRFYTGVAYRSITGSYRLNSSSSLFYVREGDKFWGYNQFEGLLDYYLRKSIVFTTGIGHTFQRKYTLYSDDHQQLMENLIYRPFQDGFYFHAQLSYRIRFDSPD